MKTKPKLMVCVAVQMLDTLGNPFLDADGQTDLGRICFAVFGNVVPRDGRNRFSRSREVLIVLSLLDINAVDIQFL